MPHTRRAMAPTELLRFDWDRDGNKEEQAALVTREDFERMRKRFGGE